MVDHPCVFVFAAQTGDELAMDTNEDGSKNHSGMCIAFDAAAGRVWSVEGNVSGRSGLGDNYESRRAGNEAFVLDREPDAVMGHGFVDAGMLV